MVETKTKKLLTVICPVYNEMGSIPIFTERLKAVREQLLEKYNVDLLFSNNASTDDTLAEILKLRAENPFIHIITLSRNVGYQASLECGLRTARGDLFVFIDVDCEDPPEMILDFVKLHEEGGYDIVFGERVDRHEPTLLMWGRKIFYRVLKAVADEEVVLDMAEFSLMTEEVRDAIVEDSSSFPFIRASIGRVGFRRMGIPYKRDKRVAGHSSFSGFRLIYFAVAGILSSSTLFLRLPVQTFFFWLAAVFALAIVRVYNDSRWIDAAIIMLSATYLGSAVAFIAIYTARTYKNSLNRPNFIISKRDSYLQSGHLTATVTPITERDSISKRDSHLQ
ncbi:MAG: glycosyltransferase [Candidatus Melainabacteria bacterium]|nr:glycosyltransferase [Candidatus Melainabacteria bacterium]